MAQSTGPKQNPSEQVRKGWVNIGRSLENLRRTISTRSKIKKEKKDTPEEEEAKNIRRDLLQRRITDGLKGIGGSMEALSEKISRLNLPPEAEDRYTAMELALFGTILEDGTVTANELLDALTDGEVQIDPATGIEGLTPGDLGAAEGALIISAKDLDDEIKGINELRTAGEKFESKIEGLYKMLPESVRGMIDSSTFVAMIEEFIAKWLEGAGIATGFAATLRMNSAKRKARDRGYELRDDYMIEVEAEFQTKYEEWLAKKAEKPDSKEPPPDMFGMIVAKYKEVGASEEEQERLKANETNIKGFKTAAKDGPMFGAPTAEVKVEGNEYKAERPAGGQWTVTIPMEGFNVIDPEADLITFELKKSSPDLKKALEAANGVAAIETVKIGDEVQISSKEIVVSAPSPIGQEGMNNLISLCPDAGTDKWASVKIATGPTVKRSQGVLEVPEGLLSHAAFPKLRAHINAADPSKALDLQINGAGDGWADVPPPQPQPQPQNPPPQQNPPQNP